MRKPTTRMLLNEIEELNARLEEAQDALRAIRQNEIDALVVEGPSGPQVFTLEGAEQPYRIFIETMNEGAVTISSDGTILHSNNRFAQMLERPLSQAMGTSFFNLVIPHQRGLFSDMIAGCGIEGCRMESVLAATGDRKVPVYLSIKPLTRDKEMFCVIVTDLTDIKSREEELRGANEELLQAHERLRQETAERELANEQLRQSHKMEAMGTLAGGIAHDFNNILAAIIGFAEMAQEDLPEDNPVSQWVNRILTGALRGRDLVKQILAFSRKSDVDRQPVSLSATIKETIHLLRASLPTTIEIELDMKATRDTIFSSPTELQQILVNLATNALFAMRNKGGTLRIGTVDSDLEPHSAHVIDAPPGRYIELTVSDTGTGMTAETRDRMFEPFFTTKMAGQGSGMGMAVVYGTIKNLRGTIIVDSTPGEGTTFRIFLPAMNSEMRNAESDLEVVPGGSARILFVDDEEPITEWGQQVLTRLGYEVAALTDSRKALRLFYEDPFQFDLVIVDQTMPLLTGLNLSKKLREIRSDIPIILCSGYSDVVSSATAKQSGINEFLSKPVGKLVLAQAVQRVLTDNQIDS